MNLLLKNLRWYHPEGETRGDIRIRGGKFVELGRGLSVKADEIQVNCSDVTGFPGLINAHDHLECNLFPRLGNPPYDGFRAWARDIYKPEDPLIRDILKVAMADRLWFGGLKNLISGVTTVVHHDRFHPEVFVPSFPVKVLYPYAWSHSPSVEGDIGKKRSERGGMPFIIHAGEGLDDESRGEIEYLDDLGVLDSETVLVHCIGVSEKQIGTLFEKKVKVVWCPSSNYYLYDCTAPIDRMKETVRVSLGTDSTMSGEPFLLDELRAARSTAMVSDEELVRMVYETDTFKIRDGRGIICVGAPADLVLISIRTGSVLDAIFHARPRDLALVLIDGNPRFACPEIAQRLGLPEPNVRIGGRKKWLWGPVAQLKARISQIVSPEVLSKNPVWEHIETDDAPSVKAKSDKNSPGEYTIRGR